ncbi:hypothetical protein REB14_03775 [Chryseobacterium sp. ES2]|uniref:C1q domain-containing protein n=1 Tax=Chryseobacterium metallicongregator TaxID=3073042 RepID=A0ABU1E0I2_9FLAO|nr:hypothetical protein [Chryseobacterium sp. ES2]MDR4951305.1 hypothetical protein [Chryseobacterium sp. ES2]
MLAFFKAYSQTGINTSTPNATLDVRSKGTTNATKALGINDSNNNELVSVLDNGAVRLAKYKNFGVLGTDANGFLLDSSNLNIASLSYLGSGFASATNTASSKYIVLFGSQKSTPDITYNNGLFTVNNAGFYQFTAFTMFDISMNTPSGGIGYTQVVLNAGTSGGSTLAYNYTTEPDGLAAFGHTASGFVHLNVGDVVKVQTSYSKPFKISGGSIGFVYYGT